jgi:hypothetical protein
LRINGHTSFSLPPFHLARHAKKHNKKHRITEYHPYPIRGSPPVFPALPPLATAYSMA